MCKLLNDQEYLVAVNLAMGHFSKQVELTGSYRESVLRTVRFDISWANRTGELENLAKEYGFYDYLNSLEEDRKPSKKVCLIGGSRMKKKDIYQTFESHRIARDSITIYDYDLKGFDLNEKYDVIFSGPIPHKVRKMGKTRSVLSKLERNRNCRRLVNNQLKITKNTLNRGLEEWS
ncbi:MAG: hypothetical protein KBT48_09845 [Firmicutes bacterium]|nr:hypothetical protein [Bacillota bacterium]